MKQWVYVKDEDGNVLPPTSNCGHVRWLLKNNKAKVIQTKPFQIKLLCDDPELCQPKDKKFVLGIDPGRQNIGLSVLIPDGTEVFEASVETRNKDIPDLMKERKVHRSARRQHLRARKRRTIRRIERILEEEMKRKGEFIVKQYPRIFERRLPGCKKSIKLHDILNSEARFLNRKRKKGWITPTVRQLVQTHINLIKIIQDLIPISAIAFELNKFSFMVLSNGKCYGSDFQNGLLKGYANVGEYIEARQDHLCYICNKRAIKRIHHVIPKRKGGSDRPANLIGLCEKCHEKVHTGMYKKKIEGMPKTYHHLSVLNQAIPFIVKEIA